MPSPQPLFTKREQRDVARAVHAVADLLCEAMQDTIAEGSPDPAREAVESIVESAESSGMLDASEAGEVMITYLLLGWASEVREALAHTPDRVAQILGWVEEHLGKRYRLRARYTAGVLDSDEGLAETIQYAEGLGEDFLPSIVWLLAGAVARFGDGDVEWLDRLRSVDGE
jgi:hypothetical protein